MKQRTVLLAGDEGPRRGNGCNSPAHASSTSHNWLLELWLKKRYGRLEGLVFRDGEPLRRPRPRLIQTVKLGGRNGPRSDVSVSELASHPKVLQFFDHLSAFRNGTIRRLTFQDGLPDMVDIEPEDQA